MSSLHEIYSQLGRQIVRALGRRQWTRAMYRVDIADDGTMQGGLLVEEPGSQDLRAIAYRWKGIPPGHRMNAVREQMAAEGKPRWRAATFEVFPDGTFRLRADYNDDAVS